MEKDYSGYPPFMDFGMQQNSDFSEIYKDSMFNPMVQYEQAYIYYKYLCMQMDYRLKCKEYEKMCSNSNAQDKKDKRIE